MKRFGILAVMGYVISGGLAHAATYYASPNGSDRNSCAQARSLSSAMATINSALACLSAGDTLYVRAGTYDEEFLNVPSGTSWSRKVRIAAYPGETVWVTPSATEYVAYLAATQQYIEFDGINMNGLGTKYGTVTIQGWSGGNAHHIRIKNAELIFGSNTSQDIRNAILATAIVPGIIGGNEFINLTIHGQGDPAALGYAFYINSSDNVIDGCELYNTSTAAVHIYSGYGTSPDNNSIRNNRIHDVALGGSSQNWGILVKGNGNKVYNNLVYGMVGGGTGNAGIFLFGGSSTEVYNNTVYGGKGEGIAVNSADVTGSIINNNISYNNASGDYRDDGSGTTTGPNNLFGIDPLFVDVNAHNFQLRAGSPAINAGQTLSLVTTDILGTKRPASAASDIGAYEFQAASGPADVPSTLHIIKN
jgi:hypothetical protein